MHTNNRFQEVKLLKFPPVKESLTVQKEGQRKVKRKLERYTLDVINSVGYRVKSKQGTQTRIWATQVLRHYLLKGDVLIQWMDRIESQVEILTKEVNRISLQVNTKELPAQGIFFDAYRFAADLIRSAKKEIILIDNYVDDTVLTLFSKRSEKVQATIYTKHISKALRQDLDQFNSQYEPLQIKEFSSSHDRFLMIDRKGSFT